MADSGPFGGLLLTVLGSRSDFNDGRTPWCVYVSVSALAVLADSGPFHGLLLTVLGSTLGAFTCRSSTLGVFVDSGLFRALLLTILGSKSDFHD